MCRFRLFKAKEAGDCMEMTFVWHVAGVPPEFKMFVFLGQTSSRTTGDSIEQGINPGPLRQLNDRAARTPLDQAAIHFPPHLPNFQYKLLCILWVLISWNSQCGWYPTLQIFDHVTEWHVLLLILPWLVTSWNSKLESILVSSGQRKMFPLTRFWSLLDAHGQSLANEGVVFTEVMFMAGFWSSKKFSD